MVLSVYYTTVVPTFDCFEIPSQILQDDAHEAIVLIEIT